MKWSDLQPGTVVYHRLYTHRGKGTVRTVVPPNGFERMFERGSLRAVVVWEHGDGPTREIGASLRDTPNRKRILEMVKFYAKRGAVAQDGGDRLILPTPAAAETQA